MRRRRLIFRDLRRQPAPWQAPERARHADRERRFLQGAPLALAGGIAFLPAWLFLVHTPRFAHAQLVAVLVLPLLVLSIAAGLKKLVTCMLEQPFDHLTALSFGVLLIFVVVLVYSSVFFYVARW
jgi:hypothetical protein